ncbi:MAG: GGDEF domain-containing protein [Anaerolineales bacterium]|nr:GGDEF domain-containing protein [Anaerolineales bacterium]
MKVIIDFGKTRKPFWIAGGLALLGIVVFLDYFTGNELSFSFFYLIPIAILSWVTNSKAGIAISFFSAGIWLTADIASGARYSSPTIYFWNTMIRFCFFLLIILLIRVAKALELEKRIARTDYLTGAVTTRFFSEIMQMEIDRSIRYQHQLTIAFIDIDNFKTINDRFGHSVGDKVLEKVAWAMQKYLRKTDIVARVGGDEFAILLPEAGADVARSAISKMQHGLHNEMQANHWPVTFSIGVMTFNTPPDSADEMLNIADKIMYSVKNSGKNNISYVTGSSRQMPKPNT